MARSTRTVEACLVATWVTFASVCHGATAGAPVRLTILYDNTTALASMRPSWGFSCLVEAHGKTLLVDAGGKPDVLRDNLSAMGTDASKIDAVVFSHAHGDHTAGIPAIRFRPDTPAFAPRDSHFPEKVGPLSAAGLRLAEVTNSLEILPGFHVSDALNGPPFEIALAINLPPGLVVITGCAHPGIIPVLKNLSAAAGRPIHAVIGGFHLLKTPDDEVRAIIAEFHKMGIARVGPTHCTGDAAIRMFREAFATNFIGCGAGRIITFPIE